MTFSVSALIAQVPDGGIMLNNEGAYQKIGPGTLTKVSVEGQSFTEALRYVVGSGFDNVWNVQIRFPAVNGIEVDDIILVAFYARSVSSQEETGEGYVTVVLEDNINYAKEISSQISFGSEWKEYYASAKSSVSLAANEVNYTFFCGYENQTIEIADVRFLNYKNTLNLEDLPFTKISYNGQEPDAPWRAEATERIQQLRKGPVDIMVYDESGNPAEGATVSVEMKKHQFKFGSAVALSPYISNSVYKEKIFELFNEIVWENDLKWPALDPNSDYPQLKNALMELADSGVTVRGHNIIWPSWQFTPDYLETLKDDTVALRREITNRIEHAATFTKGYVIDWDVINETYTNYDIMDILGYEEMADWFKRTRYYDKDVKLYMNDYSILSSSGKDVKHQDHYFETIQ